MSRPGTRGFTLVEIIVALVVLAVGLIGLASAGTVATRLAGLGHWDGEAAALAARRLEVLRSQACSGPAYGEAAAGPFTVSWALTGVADPRYRRAYVSVTRSPAIGGPVSAFANLILC